jgi:hypothetical protein
MSRIDRIRRAVSAHGATRSDAKETAEAFEPAGTNLPVPVGPTLETRSFRDERRRQDSEFHAHLIGQDGERRGLRAGATLIDRARMAYNRIEWSGANDRRARAGRHTRTDI